MSALEEKTDNPDEPLSIEKQQSSPERTKEPANAVIPSKNIT